VSLRPAELLQQLGAAGSSSATATVLAQKEVTSEEVAVERRLSAALRTLCGGSASLELLWGPTLYHPDDLPFRRDMADLPNLFTAFRQKVVSRPPSPQIALPRLPASCGSQLAESV
jgi:DNA photolyase